jgi:hypothetical protein
VWTTFSAPSFGGGGEENERLYRRFKFLTVRVDDKTWFDRGAVTRFLNATFCFKKEKVAGLRAARDKEQVPNIIVGLCQSLIDAFILRSSAFLFCFSEAKSQISNLLS